MATDIRKVAAALEATPVNQATGEAPVIYVEGAQGFLANPEQIKFNLFQDLLLAGPGVDMPIVRRVCARIVLSPTHFLSIADWLGEQAKQVRAAMAGATQTTES